MGRGKSSDIEALIGHRFGRSRLLEGALTHPSAPDAAEIAGSSVGYERLEFLGDRVLGLVVAEMLTLRFPDENEGALSKRLVGLVRTEMLLEIAKDIDLAAYMRMADGSGNSWARQRDTMLADGMEALIGAVFLDGGYKAASAVVRGFWEDKLDASAPPPKDPKTTLQEWAQARALPLPVYDLAGREGPDHQPVFRIVVHVEGQPPMSASGKSKRAAEQAAAEALLAALPAEDAP